MRLRTNPTLSAVALGCKTPLAPAAKLTGSSISFANPKSKIFAWPRLLIITLAGLMSR